MELQGISKNELKEVIKEAMISVLAERKDLLEEAVSEAILDMKLGLAIEEGDTGEYVPEAEILSKLTGQFMDLLYAKRFSKDLDSIQKEPTRKALLKAIKAFKEADSISQIKAVKKIEGYQDYYRIRIGEYRLGIKIVQSTVELIPPREAISYFHFRPENENENKKS